MAPESGQPRAPRNQAERLTKSVADSHSKAETQQGQGEKGPRIGSLWLASSAVALFCSALA